MKTLFFFSFIAVLSSGAFAQPLSGSYTVGGSNPDFTSLKSVEYALTAQGVSDPVFFNIRPGVYRENGGNNSVMKLDSLVAGVSETNRITFQPDESAGGNVNNVILQFNRTNPATADADLVIISVDFVTIQSLSFEDIDSSHTFNNHLLKLKSSVGNSNLNVDGFILEGCRFVGTPFIQNNSSFLGTDHGIGSTQTVGDVVIRGNTFVRLLHAISIVNGSAVAQASITVEENIILEGYRSLSGSGNILGAGIEISCTSAVVSRNIIDFANTINGGMTGITVRGAITGLIEKNLVKGLSAFGIRVFENSTFPPDSILIANNMITGCVFQAHPSLRATSLQCEARNSKIFFNTIVVPPVPVSSTAIRVVRPDCEVFNNIILMYGLQGFTIVYDQGNQASLNLQSDHNIIYKEASAGNGPFVVRNGVQYPTLSTYQTATGLDTNTVSKAIEFLDLNSDLHLTECQSHDPDLRGIPLVGITDDFDGDLRNIISPIIGADEPTFSQNYFFENLFTEDLQGTPFSIAAGKFDNLIGDGIAVPDYDNNQILLYHNNASTHSFSLSGTLSTSFKPLSTVFHDFDDDGNLDLIVGGDNPDGIKIFWGDGIGNFPAETDVSAPGAVLNLLPEPTQLFPDFKTIFVPLGQFVGYLMNFGNRDVCLDLQRSDVFGTVDTIPDFINGAVIGNYIGTDMVEMAGISNSTGNFGIIHDIHKVDLGLGSCSDFSFMADYTQQNFGTGWYSYANSIIQGDFDNDSDIDFITTGFSSTQLIFIRNQGNLNFSDEPFSVPDIAHALVVLDYENDGDLDFAAVNNSERNSVTLFINDGLANFTPNLNCFQQLVSGSPAGVVAKDFDLDGLTDIAVSTLSNKFFVLYNLGLTTSVNPSETSILPDQFTLAQNYPNPFNPTTTIKFSIPEASVVTLKIYNILGEEVKTLIDEFKEIGNHSVQFNASQLSSGIYFYRLKAGSFIETKKMILLR